VAPAPPSVGDLLGRLRDDRADAAAAQVRADGFGRIRLVREHRLGPGARASDRARHPQGVYQQREVRGIA
jgi:hypothetical protein